MLAPQFRFRIVEQAHHAAADRRVAVARRHEEIDLQRSLDGADEVAQEDEAALEQPEHEQLPVRIGGGDLRPQLPDARLDGVLVVYHAPDGSAVEARINRTRAHCDTR